MKNQKGFTMVEMIIVIAIVAVLAMFIIPAVSSYMKDSKIEYNKKLINQLEISGKNYYSENKGELPKKPYNRVALIKSSHVALPTLQSSNFVSKDFVDSEGKNCTESYVFVRQPGGTTENEYHPCLICDGINYSKEYYNDPYCDISNWNDKTAPNCGIQVLQSDKEPVINPDGTQTIYNPNNLNIGVNESIAYIKIEGYDNNGKKLPYYEELDVSKMTTEQILGINLMGYFPKDENGEIITASYKITVMDQGGNESYCKMDPNKDEPDITIIMDKEKPSCELKVVQNCDASKYDKSIYFDSEKTKDNWSKQENLKVLIANNNNEGNKANIINNFTGYKYSLVKQADGTYYGYVKDEAGNISEPCDDSVKIEMCPGDQPYCLFTKNAPDKWLKKSGVADLLLECYVDQSLSSKYDSTKLVSSNKLGTPVITGETKGKGGNPDRTEYKIKYTATSDEKEGKDNVVVKPGFFKTTTNKMNDEVKSKEIKVDGVLPKIAYTTNPTAQKDGWYVKGVKVTSTCTDNGSGVKDTMKVNSITTSASHKINDQKISYTETINSVSKSTTMPKSYTTTCEDKAGNKNTGKGDFYVRDKSFDGSGVNCEMTAPTNTNWLGLNKTSSVTVKCYIPIGKTANVNTKKVGVKNARGTISSVKSTGTYNISTNKVVEYKITYKASVKGKSGADYIVVNPEFVKAGTYKNSTLTSDKLKVDTKAPSITWSLNKTMEKDGWYKTSASNPFKATATGTDGGSGMASIKIGSSSGKTSVTVSRKTAARPVTYKAVAVDAAGNKAEDPNDYYLRVYGVDKSCKCAKYKKCATKDCGCAKPGRCEAAGCASWHYATGYNYEWGATKTKSGSSYPGDGISKCKAGNVGKFSRTYKGKTVECVRKKKGKSCAHAIFVDANSTCCAATETTYKWSYKKCTSSSYSYADYCNYWKESYTKCKCEQWKTCEDDACDCKTREECWHY